MKLYELPEAEAVTIILWTVPTTQHGSECVQRAEDLALEAGLKIMGRLAKEGLLKPGEDPVALVDAMIGVYKDAIPDW